eukprot:TRINITY_DN4127_c0_g1_i1.p1 TRINITY_DN4127_c0_g1~~TRINITY_DN4127_c0_g1_i1.p1  ORF type:complete len:713 (-),score=165.71 TRINITY_DN4127_c0_g1_i1:86-2179(-)
MDRHERRVQAISNHIVSNGNIETATCSSETDQREIERRRVNIPVEEMTNIIFGGADRVKIYKEAYARLEKEPLFSSTVNIDDLEHHQIRELSMARIRRLFEMKAYKLDVKTLNILGRVLYAIDPSLSTRLGVHSGLFMGSLSGNGTEYHKKKYFKPAMKGKILGCFGMTELGHGSNAAGLETTATFDKKTQEFVIHSPTLTATKWWIGGAAETATHSVIFARLIIGEKDYGVHCFVVQLRDIATHQPMSGVTIGDCGMKMGMNGIDNGYIRFNEVRIPREDMLDQYARVEPDGSYWKAGKASLALQRIALIGARTNIVGQSALDGMQALTIAIRYASIRRQFEDAPGNPERQIIDYQTHMHRLFLPLADILSLQFASLAMDDSYNALLEELLKGNTKNVGDVHALAAGMKAFSSWTTRDAITICRDTLGGHGFSAYNRIARMMKDFQVQTTWDGDNTVLSQQTARYLINTMKKVMEGKKLKGSVKFLENFSNIISSAWQVEKSADLLDTEVHRAAFRWRTANLAAACATKIQQEVSNGKDPMSAWNSTLVDLIALAKSHCDLFRLEAFAAVVEKSKETAPKLTPILKITCNLFALANIERDLGTFRDNDFVNSDQARLVRQEVRTQCLNLRPYAVYLVDSFAIPDYVLDSQVGRQDGNIYEKYFERVQQAPSNPVPAYWEKVIKPLTNVSKSQQPSK